MAQTFEEKMKALAEKYGVEVTVSTRPPKTTGEIVLLPGVRPPVERAGDGETKPAIACPSACSHAGKPVVEPGSRS